MTLQPILMQTSIIIALNTRMANSTFFTTLIPILSDIFVFSYPLYLLYLYFTHETLSRWDKIWHRNHTDRQSKYHAIGLLFSFLGAIIVNFIIKLCFYEQRPFEVLDLPVNPKESLILNTIPVNSFPSDHAAVSMTIALMTLILAYQTNNKKMKTIGRIFLSFGLIMDISRITIGVHRPLDIIGGSIIGALVAYGLTRPIVMNYLEDKAYNPIINFQEYIFGLIKK